MNEEKIREIVEKVIADNMPNKDEITKKAIEAMKEAEKKENDKPWLIKKGEKYFIPMMKHGEICGVYTFCKDGNSQHFDNAVYLVAPTEQDVMKLYEARKAQRAYEQWCMEYPVDWTNKEQPKFFAYYSYTSKKVEIDYACDTQTQGVVYCANKEHIRGFIANYGHAFEEYVLGIGLPKYFLEV